MASVVSVEEMRLLDKKTMEEQGITSYELMVRAGTKLYESMHEDNLFHSNDQIIVVSGKGNNGGDGIVVASLLEQNGYNVTLFVMGKAGTQSKESLQAMKRYNNPIQFITKKSELNELDNTTILIDAVFGIGLNRNVEGLYFDLIQQMNQLHCRKKVSIDLASGLHAGNGHIMGIACIVDLTYVVEHLVYGNILGDAQDVSNEYKIVPVSIVKANNNTAMIDDVLDILELPQRPHNAHKYYYGKVQIIGGSKGMMGAPLLSALSAYRSGSGLVRVLYDQNDKDYIMASIPDILIDTYTDVNSVVDDASSYDALMVGPGLSRNKDFYQEAMTKLIKTKVPQVIDADGLFYSKKDLDIIDDNQKVVMTPHSGEFATLVGVTTKEILENPVYYVKEFVSKYPVVLILKGPCTIIASKDEIIFSTLGDPALAVAGSGDVLTGIIGSFLGRNSTAFDAAVYGVYIHSTASKQASKRYGEDSMIASDVIHEIPSIIRALKEGNH